MTQQKHAQLLSVVVPCFNEEAVIDTTHARLIAALGEIDLDLEIIYVDDGSSDRTAEHLRAIQAADPRVRIVLLARNFGHQLASTAGIDEATGDCVALIDADLQDPPELIAEMVEHWRQGYEVAYGTRTERAGETAFKLATANCFYRIINWLSDTEIPHNTGDFRLMDRKVVSALRQMPEHDRFLRGMVSWVGFRQIALPYKREERAAGETKYPLRKMLRLATDAIVSFSIKPLRLATALGVAACGISLVALVTGLVLAAGGTGPGMFATLLLGATVFFSGTQLICLGILGEYVGRIYQAGKQRPLYLVRERLGNSPDSLSVVGPSQQEAA